MRRFMRVIGFIVLSASFILAFTTGEGTYASKEGSLLNSGEENLLRYLRIVTEAELQYDRNITRGELAHVAAGVSKAVFSGSDSFFYDVPVEHTYFSDICALAEIGLLGGDGNGYFEPESAASFEAACKVFSGILGYQEVGQYKGYSRTAREAGVTDGVTADGTVTYGQLLRMAYNTLHCEMFEAVSYGSTTEYQRREGYLAIERYHGLVMQNGILNGCLGTPLDHPDSALVEDAVLINNQEYYLSDAEALLGREVIFYTRRMQDMGELDKNIVYIYADERKNQVLTVQSEDVIGKNGDVFSYYSQDKERRARLSAETDVIINGVAYPDYTDAHLTPDAGSVTLIDHNNDNLYDVVIVDSYFYLVAQGIDAENQLVYGQYPNMVVGDRERDEVSFRILSGDKLIYPKSVKAGSVLAVKKSLNTDGILKIQMELLGDGHYGYVSAISKEEICVDGKVYQLSDAMVTDETVSLGDRVTVYTHLGQCAVVLHPENDDYKVGYLVDAAAVGSTLSSTLMVRMVDSDKNLREFTAVSKVNLDGTLCREPKDILKRLRDNAALTYNTAVSKWPMSQLVRYRLNNDGLLTHIDTSYFDSARESEESLKLTAPHEQRKYSTKNRSFYNAETGAFEFSVIDSRSMWGIPYNNRDEVEWYQDWLGDNGSYRVEGYSVDPDSMVAEYIVAYLGKYTTVAEAEAPYVVTEVAAVLNDEGDMVKKIRVVGSPADPVDRYFTDSLANQNISVGDVVQLRLNRKTVVENMRTVYRAETIPDEASRFLASGVQSSIDFAIQTRIAYGTAISVKDGFLTHTTSIAEDTGGVSAKANLDNYLIRGDTRIYVYDSSERQPKVRTGTIEDITSYSMNAGSTDRVILYTDYGLLRFIYIIKH